MLQCGADGLAKDPLGTFNLTPAAYIHCANVVLGVVLTPPPKLLVLGGGGYHASNTARCFASILASFTGITQLPSDIPEHDVIFFTIFPFVMIPNYLFFVAQVFRPLRPCI